ncbi:MAG: chorismate synthase [Fimbriimonadaceae bacterium]
MASSLGVLFRITTWGESHGGGVGVVVDGCPPGLPLNDVDIQVELDRRKPGQSRIVTQRKESDTVQILSGVYEGRTLGTPILMMVLNEDPRGRDYEELKQKFRPSHADYSYEEKYGIRAVEGGGRASARETVGRVAAGAVAKKLLACIGVEVLAWVERVQDISAEIDPAMVSLESIESNIMRCPNAEVAQRMISHVEEIRKQGNSVGGCVGCVARGVPAGWGEPVFDKLEADMAKAVMSLPACKGFEVGSGFSGTYLTGLQHNDAFFADSDRVVHTKTNLSGGIQGGISNGELITMMAAFKPTATIMHEQQTVTVRHENTTISGRGRHDPCVLPRAVPMVEAMVALTLIDHALRHSALRSIRFD